jgi:4-amino-4-deoxy-L-arabinose transferase-like glycosyltransferase
MTKNLLIIFTLAAIILIGFILRTHKLGEIPNGFYVDEAAIGYNAYSLGETGRDEFGKSFPIFLRSYATYPSPLYAYLTIFSIKIFGLTVFATRILSAISGTLTIIFIYLIFKNLKIFKNELFPLLSALIFASAPWSIHFSRGAFESNLALLIYSAAIYLLIKSQEKVIYFFLACLLFGISTYAYQSERLITFLVIIGFICIYWRTKSDIWKNKKIILWSFVLFLTIQIPQFLLALQPAFSKRATGLFYKQAVITQAEKLSFFLPTFLFYPLSLAREFLSQYAVYFSPRNLFNMPDEDLQRAIPELSTFYSWMVIPYLIGIYMVVRKIKDRNIQFLVLLLLVSPIPAAVTKDPFSTLRALPMIIPLVGIITLGIETIFKKYRIATTVLAIPIIGISVLLLWRSYFVLLPNERALNWNYGHQQLAEKIKSEPDTHFVIDQNRTNPAYLILAFYLKTPPSEIQNAADPIIKTQYYSNDKFDQEYKYANLETRYINWESDIYTKQILVGDTIAISENQAKEHSLIKHFEITDPFLKPLFVGWQTHPEIKCKSAGANRDLCKQNGYL